jgi:hypothetical protein
MAENIYAKPYMNSRPVPKELYRLIVFPSDNSIAVVKSKQCEPAEHDGFVIVRSGNRRFMGVMFEEGKSNRLEKYSFIHFEFFEDPSNNALKWPTLWNENKFTAKLKVITNATTTRLNQTIDDVRLAFLNIFGLVNAPSHPLILLAREFNHNSEPNYGLFFSVTNSWTLRTTLGEFFQKPMFVS